MLDCRELDGSWATADSGNPTAMPTSHAPRAAITAPRRRCLTHLPTADSGNPTAMPTSHAPPAAITAPRRRCLTHLPTPRLRPRAVPSSYQRSRVAHRRTSLDRNEPRVRGIRIRELDLGTYVPICAGRLGPPTHRDAVQIDGERVLVRGIASMVVAVPGGAARAHGRAEGLADPFVDLARCSGGISGH